MSWNGRVVPSKDSQSVTVMTILLATRCPASWKMFFTLSSHSNVVCCDKRGRLLVYIYDQFVRYVVLESLLGGFIKEFWPHFGSQRFGNDRSCCNYSWWKLYLWYNNVTQDRPTLKSIYLQNLFEFKQTRLFKTPLQHQHLYQCQLFEKLWSLCVAWDSDLCPKVMIDILDCRFKVTTLHLLCPFF